MSWKSPREDLKKAFDYAKENKTVQPKELAEKFGITKSEATVIIEWFSWDRFAELLRVKK